MSGKRVYQGVRVKTTVKELLQRHRAREANSKKLKTISQACLELQDLCASTLPNFIPTARYVEPPPAISPVDSSSCGARALQLRAAAPYQVPDSTCSFQLLGDTFNDTQQQFGDTVLPGNCYSGTNNNNNNNDGGGSYSTSLPPPPIFPLSWCHGLSSDADYYGNGMAPCSPPESLKLCSPMDPNSYSPQDSFSSSSSSSCYNSPSRMESSYHGVASEHYHYPHCNLQDCYSLPHCWPGQQESYSAPEYTAYYNPSDYSYTCPVEENYFKRDLQMGSEMCYNVL